MAFRQMMKQILVNDRPVKLPERVSAREIIMSIGKDPNKNDLVLANPNGTIDLYPSNAIIRVKDNAEFETQLSSRNG